MLRALGTLGLLSSIYFQEIISRKYFIFLYIEKYWPNNFS